MAEKASNFIDKEYIRLRNQYFLWLCSMVCRDLDFRDRKTIKDTYDKDTYWHMLRTLGKTEFYSVIERDDNRAGDGVLLRESFCNDLQYDDDIYRIINTGPCSVLEMLVALSSRLAGIQDTLSIYDIFWIMCGNLGVAKDDLHINLEEMKRSLDIFLNRRYKKDGTGGLFPLKKYKNDQTEIEIWIQANAWLNEHIRNGRFLP